MAMPTERVVFFHSNFEGSGTTTALKLVMTDSGVRQLQFTKETLSGVYVKENKANRLIDFLKHLF